MRLCTVTLILMLAAFNDVPGQTKGPAIYFEKTSIDVGTIAQGETIKQVFTFTNKGSGTLQILDVAPS